MRITYSSKCPDFENINNITDPLCHIERRNKSSEDIDNNEEVVQAASQLENMLQINVNVVENVNTFLSNQQGFHQPFFRTNSSNNIPDTNSHSDSFQNMLLDASNNQSSNIQSNIPNSEFHFLFQGINNYNLYSDQDNSRSSNSTSNFLNVAENYTQESSSETASETDDSDADVAIIVDRVGRTLSFSSYSEF